MSESPLKMDIGEREGKVILQFGHAVKEITLDPENAKVIGQTLVNRSITCAGGRVVLAASQQDITDAVILKKLPVLRRRVAFKLKKAAEAGWSNAKVAENLIDFVLSEIT